MLVRLRRADFVLSLHAKSAIEDRVTDSVLFAANASTSDLLSIVREKGVYELLEFYPGCTFPRDTAIDTLATLLECEEAEHTDDELDPSLEAVDDDGPSVQPASEHLRSILRALKGRDLDLLAERWREAQIATLPSYERRAWKDPGMGYQLRRNLEELSDLGAAVAQGKSLWVATDS